VTYGENAVAPGIALQDVVCERVDGELVIERLLEESVAGVARLNFVAGLHCARNAAAAAAHQRQQPPKLRMRRSQKYISLKVGRAHNYHFSLFSWFQRSTHSHTK
jgi:hypothetical protein